MKRKHLLLTLLLALFAPWAANAQVMMLFSEDFEGGTMPSGWTQEYINGTTSWSVATGDYSTSTGAGEGTYNAQIQTNYRGYSTRLITPVIDLSFVAGAELSFMHIERPWGADIDELRVYYRSSSSSAWTLIPGQVYTAAVPSWTTENEIFLPNISSTYQIAFEFKSNYGYGVGIDDIEIETAPACPKPIGLTCSNITTTSATLSWTENGSANDWVIQCCIDPEFMCGNAGLFNVSGTPSFTITSFEPGTTYYARVKSSCGGNGESYWSNVVSFTTKHITIVVGNGWSDNFEGSSCNWELTNSSQTNQWTLGTATNNGGSKALYVSNDSGISNAYTNNVISIVYATKTLTFETAQYFFDYDWKANGESNYDYLRAWLVPSPVDLTAGQLPNGTTNLSSYIQRTPEGWISLDGGGKLNLQTEWQTRHEVVNLTAGDYVVVFMWGNDQSSGTNPPAAIDNFSITKVTCPAPIDLIASNITDNSATISWTETGQATNWLLECCTSNDFTCETSFTVSNTPSFNLTSLAPATVYYVRVQALCGDEDDSEWSDVYSFATVTEIGDYWADDFEGSSCSWQFVNGDLANQWVWGTATHHNEGSHAIYISRDGGTTNTFDWSESCTVYATKLFHFTDDRYKFSYYWKLGGLEGWASLRVALVPASTTLTASDEVDFYYFPNDWIALDGGDELWTNYNNASWKHENRTINVPAGNYYLALIWQNSSSAFNPNPPAAVDNFSITRDVCPHDAENVTVEWTTQNSARLVWNGDGSAYEIAYCPFPFNSSDYQSAYSGGTVIELPGLDYGTTYKVKVRAWCDSDHQGFWSDDVYFTTACPEYSLPYNQNFNDCVVGDNLLPRCWNYINECTYNYYKIYPKVSQSESHDSGSSGNKLQLKSLVYYYTNDGIQYTDFDPQPQYAILPVFSDVNDLKMTLWARAESISNSGQTLYDATFKVGVMTDPTDASTFTQVATFTPTTQTYVKYTVDFSSYTGNGQYIAIMIEAAEGWGSIIDYVHYYHSVFIDDVRVFSSNPVPADLTASDITTNSAQITWIPGGEEEMWQVAYKKVSDANWTVMETYVDQPLIVLSNLDAATGYEVKVRAKSGDTFYNWSEPISFITSYPTPFYEPFTASQLPDNWGNYYASISEVMNFGAPLVDPGNWRFNNTYVFGENHATLNIWSDHSHSWLVTPNIFVESGQSLSFDLALTHYNTANTPSVYGDDDEFSVLISTDNGATWSELRHWFNAWFGPEYEYNSISTTGEEVVIDLSAYAGQNVRIAFYGESTVSNSDNDLHIDNVNISSCRAPHHLTCYQKASNAVTLAWTRGSAEQTDWQVAYSMDPDFDPNTVSAFINVHSDTPTSEVRIEDLYAVTTYYAYVRANCGSSFSAWSEKLQFVTEDNCDFANGFHVVEGSETCQGATVEWDDNGDDFTVMAGPMQFTNYFLCFFDGDQIPSDFTSTSEYGFVTAIDGDRTCAKSNNGGQHNTTADMVLNITVPIESDITFTARVSSEEDYDKAYFSIDGEVQDNFNGLSGDGIWYAYSYTLSAGTHTLRWYYQKDRSVSNFGDCLYIGSITISSYVVDEWTSYEHASSPYTITGLASNTEYWTKVIRNCTPDNHSEDGYIDDFYTLPCPAPTNLAINEVTTEYVAFTFDSEIGAYYQYCILPDGTDPVEDLFEGNTSGPASSTTFYVGHGLLGMHPDTDYRIYVRRKCGDGDFSDVVSVTFHTLNECAAYPTFSLPYTEDFEYVEGINLSDDPTENNLPRCWDYINISSDEKTKYYPVISYSSQNNFLFFSSFYNLWGCVDPQPQYAVLPPMEDVSILKMSFRAKTITNFRGTFSVGVMEGTDASTFEEIVSFDPSTSFQEYTVTFENYTGTGKRIAIMGVAADDSHRRTAVSIDDIVLELNCDAPTDLTVSNITFSTADLSWTGSPAAESYTVRYREINVGTPTFTEGFENGLGDWDFFSLNEANGLNGVEGTRAGIFEGSAHSGTYGFRFSSFQTIDQNEYYWQYLNSPEFSLSELSVLSFYYRKETEIDQETLYVGYIDDTQEIYSIPVTPPTVEWQLYTLELPANAKNIFFSYYGEFQRYVHIDDISITPASPWIEVTGITSTNSTLSGLSLNTEYQVQVKGDCSIDDWSDAVTFTTQSCTYPVPSTWDFDDDAVGQLPLCWTRMGSISNWPMVNSYYPYSGSRDLEFYHASADDETFIAVMPAFAADLNTLSMEFYGKQTYGDEPAYIEVGYMTDLNDVGSFVNAKTFYMTDTYEKYTAFFNNAPADGYIAFQTTYLNQRFAIVIDDVTVKELECEAVTNLQVTETGSKYITLNWDGQDDADFYIYYTNLTTQERLRTPGAVRPPYTLEDLSVYTSYQIEVTAECNVVNSNPYNLDLVATMYVETTFCPAPTDVTVDIIDATSATVSWTGSSEAESYTLGYHTVAIAGDNPILTQGFEEGMGDWIIGNESIGNTTCSGISTEAARSGDKGFKMTACANAVIEGNPAEGLLFETPPMTESAVLKFYYRKNEASSMVSLQFYYMGSNIGGLCNLPLTDEWQLFTLELPVELYSYQIVLNYFDPQGNPDASVYIDDITISPVAQPAGEWQFVSDIETTSYTLTDLEPDTEYELYVTSDCSYGGDISPVFFTMEEPTAVQTLNLSAGINWVSFYVETDLDAVKAALVAAMPVNGVAIAAQNGGRTTYNGGRWRGALSTLDVSQMYKITVSEACEITVEGMPIDPAAHPVSIRKGLNWIAFPFMESMTIADAFAGFATNGDQVKSMNDGQTTYNGGRWRGALNTLVPGKGYIYNSAVNANRTFVFPTGAKKATPFNPMGK